MSAEAIKRITEAVKDMPDNGLAEVFAPDVAAVGKGCADPRVACITDGAATVVEEFNRARAEFAMPPLDNGDPRLKVFQLAGELRHMLMTVAKGLT